METKKLTQLFLCDEQNARNQLTNSGAALIANHADSLKDLRFYDLDLTTVLLGNKPLVNLDHLHFYDCSGSLDSILGICRKLEKIEMINSEMRIKTLNFSLPSLKYLFLDGDKMEEDDVAKLKTKLPADMDRNDLRDNPPPPLTPEA